MQAGAKLVSAYTILIASKENGGPMGLLAAAAQANLLSAHLKSCPNHFVQSVCSPAGAASYSHHTPASSCCYLLRCISETAAAAAALTAAEAATGSRLTPDHCCSCLVVRP